MITHYLKVAIRNLLKYKTQSVISILGLAVGFTCFALSAYWIRYEMTYDTFHKDADRIHWMVRENGNLPYPLGRNLKDNFAEIEDYAVFSIYEARLFHQAERSDVQLAIADTSFMNMMDIRILEGNSNFMIHGGKEVAVTEDKAKELFGNESALGQEVELNNEKKTVCAVVNGWNKHSNIHFDFLHAGKYSKEWFSPMYDILLKVREGSDLEELEKKINPTMPEELKRFNPEGVWDAKLIPLTEMRYSDDNPRQKKAAGITFRYIVYFSIAGLLIIVCALTNYLSIFINRIRIRQKEFALRKVNGASNRSLALMMTLEFACLLLVALWIGFMIIELSYPWFCRYTRIELPLTYAYRETGIYALFLSVVALLVIRGVTGYLQRFSLQHHLGDHFYRRKEMILRKGSIVVQLIIGLSFIFCTTTINRQLHYLKKTDLGMVHHNIGSMSIWMGVDMNVWKEKIAALPMVTEVLPPKYYPLVAVGSMMSTDIAKWDGMEGEAPEKVSVNLITSGEDFFRFYNIRLVCGEWITEKSTADDICITESTVRRFGWTPQEAIGKRIYVDDRFSMVVVGVVKDCAYYSPTLPPPATAFVNTEKQPYLWGRASVLFKYKEGTWEECRQMIEEMYEQECPEKLLRLFSEEKIYSDYLLSEDMLTRLLEAASLVCILISLFGIYSLVTLTCEQRRKEIAIRKVSGATVKDILVIFFREHLLLLGIAALIAFPLGYAIMKQWLETYNRQTEIGVLPFIAIFLGIALVVAASIAHRVWQAANENPADVVKTGLYVMLILLMPACQSGKTDGQTACEKEQAKAILWVDRTGNESLQKYGFIRTAKARVNVYSDGTFRIISFCKKQEPEVVTYLKKRVAVFTIPKFFFDEGYIEPGQQYLQLRYIPEKINK